jgi:hypothetical protein
MRFKIHYLYPLLIIPLLLMLHVIRLVTCPNCLLVSEDDMRWDEEGNPIQIRCRHTRPITIEGKQGFQEATMTFLARYRVKGLVVAVQQIQDRGSWMSAADVGLAWGRMAEPEVNRHMRYGQRGRFLYYFPKPGLPVASDYLQTHTSNNHILTVSDSMLNVVKNLEPGDQVTFDGYLVKLSGKGRRGGRFTWKSSLRRTDTGDGACEIMYIERIWVNGHYYD